MKKYLILLACVFTLNANAQTTQDAKDYINTNIITNGTGAITGSKMNTALNKIITAVDSLNFLKKIDTTDIDISNGNFFLKLDTTELNNTLDITQGITFGYEDTSSLILNGIMEAEGNKSLIGVILDKSTGNTYVNNLSKDGYYLSLQGSDYISDLDLGETNQISEYSLDGRISNKIVQDSIKTLFQNGNSNIPFWNGQSSITPLEINNGYIKPTVPTYATDTDADNDTNLCNGCMYQLTGDRGYYRKP